MDMLHCDFSWGENVMEDGNDKLNYIFKMPSSKVWVPNINQVQSKNNQTGNYGDFSGR